MLNRREFKENLVEAISAREYSVSDEDIEEFLKLNYDEDSSITEWSWADFNEFASDICREGFWYAVTSCLGLNAPDEEHLELVLMYKTDESREYIDEYDDIDELRADFEYLEQHEPDLKYAVARKTTVDGVTGEERTEILWSFGIEWEEKIA